MEPYVLKSIRHVADLFYWCYLWPSYTCISTFSGWILQTFHPPSNNKYGYKIGGDFNTNLLKYHEHSNV